MDNTHQNSPSQPQNTPPPVIAVERGTILGETLYKKGSRSQSYHTRYVELLSDGTLRYFTQKSDPEPKKSYVLSELSECEVSDLYVDKHNKKLFYCLKVTWKADSDASVTYESLVDDASSIGGQSLPQTNAPSNGDAGSGRLKEKRSSFRKSPALRRARTEDSENVNEALGASRSVDDETLTFGTKLRRRFPKHHSKQSTEAPAIPKEVAVDQIHALNQEFEDSVTTDRVNNKTGLSPYEQQSADEQRYLKNQYLVNEKKGRHERKEKLVQRGKIAVAAGATVGIAVVTAGIGLVAGLVVLGVGAASGVGGAALDTFVKKREGELVIASTDYEKIRTWKHYLSAALESGIVTESTWGQLFASDTRRARVALLPDMKGFEPVSMSPKENRIQRTVIDSSSKWRPMEGGMVSFLGTGAHDLRVFREERDPGSCSLSNRNVTRNSVEGRPCPPMKAYTTLATTPLDAFLCLMSYGRVSTKEEFSTPKSEQRASFRVIETIDDHTDVIQLIFWPMYLFPFWTSPRDFVLYRYWRHEPDGSYVICYESMEHKKCPPVKGCVRGELHQIFAIAPPKRFQPMRKALPTRTNSECMLTSVVQVDPRGWVPVTSIPCFKSSVYGDSFAITALLQLLDIRDAINQDRFVPVSLDNERAPLMLHNPAFENAPALSRNLSMDSEDVEVEGVEDGRHYDFAYAGSERESINRQLSVRQIKSWGAVAMDPPPLNYEKWAEPDANSFLVRGHNYKVDRKKINAGQSIGRLIAVDIVTVDAPIYSGFSVHPKERIQLAIQKEGLKRDGSPSDLPPFIFVMNIILPGPPFYHGVFYYAIDDMGTIDGSDGTPSSKLCQRFFFGDCDKFRDRTFKLIPQIVQGNFLVRKAVGSTPAIMGKKLKQIYVRTKRSFEIIIDCGSSSVATGVIRLSLGYAKSLVVDMGFLFEGDEEEYLPEKIMGCVRMKQPEFGPDKVRKVFPAG